MNCVKDDMCMCKKGMIVEETSNRENEEDYILRKLQIIGKQEDDDA